MGPHPPVTAKGQRGGGSLIISYGASEDLFHQVQLLWVPPPPAGEPPESPPPQPHKHTCIHQLQACRGRSL